MFNVRVITVGPDLAAELLANSAINRSVSHKRVEEYARDMIQRRWNPDSLIKFDESGRLNDGQHRLAAVIRSGCTVQFIAVDGGCQYTTDTGRPRTFAQMLGLDGHPYPTVLSAAVSWLVAFNEPQRISAARGGVRLDKSIYELYDILNANKRLTEFTAAAESVRKKAHLAAGMTTAAMYLTDLISPEDADTFWWQVKTGEDLKATDPALVLRGITFKNASARDKMPERHLAAILIKAWNFYRDGNPVSMLVWRAGGAHPEPFPSFR